MEIPSQVAEMPIPLNSTYGGGHGHGHGHHAHHHTHVNMMHHHHHHHDPPQIIPPGGPAPISSTLDHDDNNEDDDDDAHDQPNINHHVVAVVPFKKPVKYKECLKNHAASMGGNATDGCGEFMPSGDDGTLEALTCSACNCHRNFHRKEAEGEPTDNTNNSSRMGRKVYLGHRYLGQDSMMGYHHHISSRAHHYSHPHPMIMSYSGSLPAESEEMEARPAQAAKKRFRTKFSQEQKEKMLSFAEKVGWKIQKQEESVVQQFCQEVGVKRRVLKVWMHNNKHNLANKTTLTHHQHQNPNINISDQNHL